METRNLDDLAIKHPPTVRVSERETKDPAFLEGERDERSSLTTYGSERETERESERERWR